MGRVYQRRKEREHDMNIETIEKLINTANTASKDFTRYNLCTVLVKPEGEWVKMVSTDGHKMSINRVRDERLSSILPEKGILVRTDDIKTLKSMKYKTGVDAVLKHDTLHIGALSIRVELDTSVYPDYEAVIPKLEGVEIKKIAFNVEYLEELLTSLRNEKKTKGIVLEYNATQDNPPIIVKTYSDNAECFGVLMPLRIK